MDLNSLSEFTLPVLTFVGGLLTHIVGSTIFESVKYFKRRGHLALEGNWIEIIDREKNKISHSAIKYDKRQGIYMFNGTNYIMGDPPKQDGLIFCDWETITSAVDIRNKNFYYIYNVTLKAQPGVSYYGVGVMTLDEVGKFLRPSGGHFSAPELDGKSLSYSLVPSNITYSKARTGTAIIAEAQKPTGGDFSKP